MTEEFNLSENVCREGDYSDAEDEEVFRKQDVKEFVKLLKEDKVEDLAEFMHNVYEQYAKSNGWKTQESCQVKFEDLPEKNKQVMINTALQIITRNNLRISKLAGEKLNDKN